jgi:hypothetical protein
MKPTTITVVAHPDRLVPIPTSLLRSPTGAQVKILGANLTATHAHELTGKVTLDTSSPEVARYVRGLIAAGDLVAVAPDPAPAAAPLPSLAPTSPTPAKD